MDKENLVHFFFGLFLLTGIAMKSAYTYADSAFAKRPEVQHFIQEMVKEHGFKKSELNALFTQVTFQPKIIESITKPYEKKTWDVYKQIFIKPERVQEGINFWKQHQSALQLAEKKYGVPANIIVAILGVETRYGLRQGEYRVLDALSTLAFNYPPRAPFFKKELREYLLLCREHHVSPTDYLGSYAGAMGMPQFMPSSYRYYADDFAGLSKKDLMHDDNAVIASVGNYFHQHGWQLNQAVVQQAQVNGTGFRQLNFSLKTAEYPLSKLRKIGVEPLPPTPSAVPSKAGVIELDTLAGGHEYWVAYHNFYVITRYNASPQYALVVYLFSEQLKQQWAKMNTAHLHAFS
jgi:membrane-bound lytic murein transglycosylase B